MCEAVPTTDGVAAPVHSKKARSMRVRDIWDAKEIASAPDSHAFRSAVVVVTLPWGSRRHAKLLLRLVGQD